MPKTEAGTVTQGCVIYARFSSHSQREVSIDQQVRECKAFAERQGLTIIDIYEDRAMTGTNDKRPDFQRMIKDSERHSFSYVLVYALDRFARDRYDSAVYKRQLKANGVKVLSATEQISDDPTGVLMESLLEGLAEYYSRELSRKIIRGQNDNAMKGMKNGGVSPLGYCRGQDGRYAIIPEEAVIVQEIFRRVDDGETFASIFRDLNDRGILTKRKSAWNRSSLCTMLSNEKYIGIYQYRDIRIEDAIPPIIDRRLFERVQTRLATKPNAKGDPKRRMREDGTYLLTGKLYCGECGSPMIGVSGTGRNGLHFYYTCKARREKKNDCHKRQVTRDFAERLISEHLRMFILSETAIQWLAKNIVAYLQSNQSNDDIRLLQERLDNVQREKNNVLNAIKMGIVTPSTRDMLMQLEADEIIASGKLKMEKERVRSDVEEADVVSFLESFRDGDIDDKAYQEQLIDAFLVRAYLYDDKLKLVFTYTGTSTNEMDIPFDINDAENAASDVLEIDDIQDTDAVRISASNLH